MPARARPNPESDRAIKKRRYEETKHLWRERQAKNRKRARDHIWSIKTQSKCKCGAKHPAVLDFHHQDPSQKEVGIHEMIQDKWSIARIGKELAKCVIMCSNCHRILHYQWEQRRQTETRAQESG
jgi:hypothetical protein